MSSILLALFLALGVLIVAASLPYAAAAYLTGFERAALQLVLEDLDKRIPDPDAVRLEFHVRRRWAELVKLAAGVGSERDDAADRDRALAVLMGHDGSQQFISSIEDARRDYQERALQVLRRWLEDERDLNSVIMSAHFLIRCLQLRLVWFSSRMLGPLLYRNLKPRIDAVSSLSTVTRPIVALLAVYMVAVATQPDDLLTLLLTVVAAWAVLVEVVGLWGLLGRLAVRTTAAYLGHALWRISPLMVLALVVHLTMAVAMTALLMEGVLQRFWLNATNTVTRAIDGVHLSPALAAAIGLFLVNALLVLLARQDYQRVRERRVPSWERLGAGGRLIAWTSLIPINIGITATMLADHRVTAQFPAWVADWVFACWAVGALLCLGSVALRRRTT